MRVTIRAPHLGADDEIRDHIGERTRAVLGHVEDRITSVQVHLADLNGPRGGIDKQVEVVVNCGHLGVIRADAKSTALRSAIDAALLKVKRAVTHAIDHKQAARRSGPTRRRT